MDDAVPQDEGTGVVDQAEADLKGPKVQLQGSGLMAGFNVSGSRRKG